MSTAAADPIARLAGRPILVFVAHGDDAALSIVDDEIVAQADQFVAPRLTPQRQDPGYGVLSCGSVTDFDPSQQYSAELPGTPATPAAPATPVAH